MNRFVWSGTLVAAALVAAALVAAGYERDLRDRIQLLELAPHFDPIAQGQLQGDLEELEAELGATRRSLEEDRTAEEFRDRLVSLEVELGETHATLDRQGEQLEGWESQWAGHEPETYEGRISELRDALEKRWTELDEIAVGAARIAREDRERIEALDASLTTLNLGRDMEDMWHDLVGPVAQIAGEATVGSGVLLESQRIRGSDDYQTLLLTSWHVVRDIYGSVDRVDMPVDVKTYLDDGSTKMESATMLAYDVELDVALLRLATTRPVQNGARLASRERLARVQVFDPVYAVGCPLGNDPIPTVGEVAATRHEVDGESYWMISAPTYIGNSGGGIFDAGSHELLGIFSKIYTHGAMRSTIVPHMGLVTPLEAIYDWFETTEYGYLARGGPLGEVPAPEPTVASAAR